MTIAIEILGDRELIAKFDNAGPRVRDNLVREITRLTLKLESLVKTEYLSGPTGEHTLSVITGKLRRSVFSSVAASGTTVTGKVAYGSEVPYAAIHEFGGTIHIPEIVPVTAKALHFMVEGHDVFAKRVKAHDVKIPERAPLRTAFAQMIPEIEMRLSAVVSDALL